MQGADRSAEVYKMPKETEREIKPILTEDFKEHIQKEKFRFANITSGIVLLGVAVVALCALLKYPINPPSWAVNMASLLASGAIAYLFAEKSFGKKK